MTPELFEQLLPLACSWAAEQESIILSRGVPLSHSELADAKAIGVQRPERVRLLSVLQVPSPTQQELARASLATGLISAYTLGLTLRYGIFIRADHWGKRWLVAHELTHTLQYERLGGGFDAFLRLYLTECAFQPYYPNGPLEMEAKAVEDKYRK